MSVDLINRGGSNKYKEYYKNFIIDSNDKAKFKKLGYEFD